MRPQAARGEVDVVGTQLIESISIVRKVPDSGEIAPFRAATWSPLESNKRQRSFISFSHLSKANLLHLKPLRVSLRQSC